MKIFKWVPISNSDQKKKILKNDNKENSRKASLESSHQTPNFGLTTEDSNTCKCSVSLELTNYTQILCLMVTFGKTNI